MHIIIIGGGAVGQQIAQTLIDKKQDVILIDRDKKVIDDLRGELNINLIHGNGANVDVLEKAKIESAGLLIATMKSDDANIISCMIAKTISKSVITIARIRDPESAGSIDIDTIGLSKKQVGLDVIISPEIAVAQELLKKIMFFDVGEAEYFAQDTIKLIGIKSSDKTITTEKNIAEISMPTDAKIIGISRNKKDFSIASDSDIIHEGDTFYLLGSISGVRNATKTIYSKQTRQNRIIILGGGETGLVLAQELESMGESSYIIKIIEENPFRCEELNRILQKTIVIQGDTTERSYFNEEELEEADILVSTTGDDRTNIIASVMGHRLGVSEIYSVLEDADYLPVYNKVGIESVIIPAKITSEKILRYVNEENITLSSVLNDTTEIFEVILKPWSQAVAKKIATINLPKEVLIVAILREGSVIIPNDKTILKADDHLIVVSPKKSGFNIPKFFYANKA